MRTVVFAYHNMGLIGLDALVRAGYDITAVMTHEDDPDERCWFGSVKNWSENRGIPAYTPGKLDEPSWIERIAILKPEMIFSFYYRRILPESILDLARSGAYNLHGSLLPAYRGRCPVNWVLIEGETKTGVTLHHMVREADAGDIVCQRAVAIDPEDTALTLYGRLCGVASGLLDECLPQLAEGKAPRIPQDLSRGSYYGGRKAEDGRIDWRWPARRIYNLIRAVTEPYPGAFGYHPSGSRLLVWWAKPDEGGTDEDVPGRITLSEGNVWVGTGQGNLRLMDVETDQGRFTKKELFHYFQNKEGLVLK